MPPHPNRLAPGLGLAPGLRHLGCAPGLPGLGAGLDVRLTDNLVAGLVLSSALLSKSTSPDIAAQLSLEAGIHLGYRWHPE